VAKKAGSRYFPSDELTYPGLERGNVFVATKVIITQQERGVCEDQTMRCHSADDCSKDVGAECTPNKLCKEPSWCPVIVDGSPQEEVYKLNTAEVVIWVKSAIQFALLNPGKMFHESMTPVMFPEPGFNTITLRQILLECSPPVRYEEVSELGAAIEVQWVWNCNVDFPTCTKQMVARRLDVLLDEQHIGFRFGWPFYTSPEDSTSNSPQRELKLMAGIRLYFRTVGTGQKISIAMIIFKCSTGLALLGFAPIIADLMMLNCFKLSKKYTARKYIYSQDFSDFFDDLPESDEEGDMDADEVEDEQEDEEWRRRMDEEDE